MIKLKSLITEQEFKAKSKETGRVVVFKSKENMEKAFKAGTAEPLDKKTSDKTDSGKPEKVKGQDLFKKDKPKSTSSPVKVSKQATKKVSDLSNEIEKNIDDAYEDLDSDERDDFAATLQFIGTTLEDEIDYDNLSDEDKKEFDEIFGDIEDQVMHLQTDELGMGSIEGDPREVSKRAVKFINKFSTKNEGIIKLKSLLKENDVKKVSSLLGKSPSEVKRFVDKYDGLDADDLLDVLDTARAEPHHIRRYSLMVMAAMKGNRRALKGLDQLFGFL